MALDPRLAAEELARRAQNKTRAEGTVEAIRKELFAQQIAFVDDPSKYKAAITTRRAGKTSMWSRYCVCEAIQNSRVLIRIWAVSRIRAKQLLWVEFIDVCRRHQIRVDTNETELSIRFENGSEIRLLGADKDKEVQKKRGDKTWMEVILETQLFGAILQNLVEDVADPCLIDERQRGGGIFCLEGTPGPLCVGYWYDVTGREDSKSRWASVGNLRGSGSGWSCHHWSVFQNPFMSHARIELDALKQRRRWSDDNPTYIREWKGRWVDDHSVLYYRVGEDRNTYDPSSIVPVGPGWSHSLGWDLGSIDSMALVVWAFHPNYPDLYEAFSWKQSGALANEVMAQIASIESQGYNFEKMVADTGGGGKMYVEEVLSRYNYPFEAAQKTQKAAHARLLNEDLLTGHVKLIYGSPLYNEMVALPIDPDWTERYGPATDDSLGGSKRFGTPKPVREDPRFENHCCFVAGTLITTSKGDVPIEKVRVGDFVLTRQGFKLVTKAQSTGFRPVIEHLGLVGTPEHPIWTENRGWVRLDRVSAYDVLFHKWKVGLQNGVDSNGTGTQIRNSEPSVSTFNESSRERSFFSTERFGRPLTDLFQRNGTFITRMETLKTTILKTWSSKKQANTHQSTSESFLNKIRDISIKTYEQHKKHPRLGSVALKSFMRCLLGLKNTGRQHNPQIASVSSVDVLSKDFKKHRCAVSDAERGELVWALSVSEAPEYFANGILVSNCDAALYAYRACRHYLHSEEALKPLPGSQAEADAVEESIIRSLSEKSSGSKDPLDSDLGRLGDPY